MEGSLLVVPVASIQISLVDQRLKVCATKRVVVVAMMSMGCTVSSVCLPTTHWLLPRISSSSHSSFNRVRRRRYHHSILKYRTPSPTTFNRIRRKLTILGPTCSILTQISKVASKESSTRQRVRCLVPSSRMPTICL